MRSRRDGAFTREGKYAWTKAWQAKVNLTLAITNSGGLTPNVQTVNFLPSAFYNATSATGATLLQAVQQKFTFGASLNHTESANRSELITFTVAFGDLVRGGKTKPCPQEGSGLRGNLGLQEWVRSAFEPVGQGELLAGRTERKDRKKAEGSFEGALCQLHLKFLGPEEQRKYSECIRLYTPTPDRELAIRWKAVKYLEDYCVTKAFYTILTETQKSSEYMPPADKNNLRFEVLNYLDGFPKLKFQDTVPCENIDELFNRKITVNCQDTVKAIAKSVSDINKHYEKNVEPYENILYDKAAPAELREAKRQVRRTEQLLREYEGNFRLPKFGDAIRGCYIETRQDQNALFRENCRDAYNKLIDAAIRLKDLDNFKSEVEKIQNYYESFKPQRPIDSLSHTVTFAVTNSAGIQPNWTLIQLNGPLTQLVNAQGVQTHTLVIAIGPAEENKTNIQNQTVLSTKSPQ